MAGQQYTVDQKVFDDLSSRLQQFSNDLPPEQQTVLKALLIMAGKEATNAQSSDVQGYQSGGTFGMATQLGNASNFSAAFNGAFGSFTGEATSPVNRASLGPYTVCVI